LSLCLIAAISQQPDISGIEHEGASRIVRAVDELGEQARHHSTGVRQSSHLSFLLLDEEARDAEDARGDRREVIDVLQPESLTVALRDSRDVGQPAAFGQLIDRGVVDVDADVVRSVAQQIGDVDAKRRRPDRAGAAVVDETVAASRMGGASSAANELPRIVPPGSASRSTAAPSPKSRNTRAPADETRRRPARCAGSCGAREESASADRRPTSAADRRRVGRRSRRRCRSG
jgi:hypothetical protein